MEPTLLKSNLSKRDLSAASLNAGGASKSTRYRPNMAIRSSRRVLKTPRNTEDAVPWALGRAPIGIYLTDAADRLIRVNQVFSTMLGYSKKQLLKMPLGELTHREDQEMSTSYRDRLLTREQKAFTF